MAEVRTYGQLAYEALGRTAESDPTWPPGATMRAWDRLPANQQAAWEAAAQAVAVAERERIRQMAIRNQAVCTGDEGTSCYFADLIQEPPDA